MHKPGDNSVETNVRMSAAAIARVRTLMQMEGDMSLMLRAYITGGGCHGFQYGFSFEEEAQEDDTTIVPETLNANTALEAMMSAAEEDVSLENGHAAQCTKGAEDGQETQSEGDETEGGTEGESMRAEGFAMVKLLIDPISLQYLRGSEIDFVHDAEGERFVIRNPNAKVTCGCARSFAV